MEAIKIIATSASDFRFGTETYRVVFSIGDQIVFQNNGKFITDEVEVNNRRLKLMGILSLVVTFRLLLTSGVLIEDSQLGCWRSVAQVALEQTKFFHDSINTR